MPTKAYKDAHVKPAFSGKASVCDGCHDREAFRFWVDRLLAEHPDWSHARVVQRATVEAIKQDPKLPCISPRG